MYVVLHSFDKISENYFGLQGLLVLLPSDDFVLNHSVPKKNFMLTLSKTAVTSYLQTSDNCGLNIMCNRTHFLHFNSIYFNRVASAAMICFLIPRVLNLMDYFKY